jgi:hypothetical protein
MPTQLPVVCKFYHFSRLHANTVACRVQILPYYKINKKVYKNLEAILYINLVIIKEYEQSKEADKVDFLNGNNYGLRFNFA